MSVQKNRSITLGGTDLSSSLRALDAGEGQRTLSAETDGDDWEWFEAGLRFGAITAQFKQDFTSGSVDEVISALIGTTFTVVVKPDAGAVSTSNPSYTATMMIENYDRFIGQIGEQKFCSVQLALAADTGFVRATA